MELLYASISAVIIGSILGVLATRYLRIDEESSVVLHCSLGALGALTGVLMFYSGGGRASFQADLLFDIAVALIAAAITLGVSRSVTRINAR